MSELQARLDRLALRLDRMGMRCEQAVIDAVAAVRRSDIDAGQAVDAGDAVVDREEVEIEQECIRLLALYQPAAVDLRTICTFIKVNSDLERIADLAASIARRAKRVAQDNVALDEYEAFEHLAQATLDILGRTVRILSSAEVASARRIIDADALIDKGYGHLVRSVLEDDARGDRSPEGAGAAMTVIQLAKALERIGDHCTNIAEDIIFLRTGDIVRHRSAQEPTDQSHPA